MSASTLDLLSRARWLAAKVAPYLSRALWVSTFVETEDVPTLAVDEHWRVYCNPAYVRQCAKDQTLPAELLHEVLHPTMRCMQRKARLGAEDHHRWNCCHDAEIDQQIEAMLDAYRPPKGLEVKLVDKRVRPKDLGGETGMTAEELYRLPHPAPKKPRCGGVLFVPGKGAGEPGPGLSAAEADLVRAGVALAIKEHAKARGRGSVPAGVLRWAEAFGEPAPVDWHAMVAARVRYALDSRRGASPSYARPARRHLTGGLILPVHRQPVARVSLVLDTSGSMGDGDLGAALAIVFDACEALGKVSVVSCDAHAGDPVEVRHVDDLREHLRGGGGTNMCVGIARADEQGPDAIVVVTDGETPWPDAPPDAAMTVVLTRKCSVPPPAWADVIQLPDKSPSEIGESP